MFIKSNMLILSTVIPNEGIQMEMREAFPDLNFIYKKGWTDGPLREAEILITYGEDLDAGELSHAILDDPEPLGKGHPLWRMENVTFTPHLSSKSGDYFTCHIRKKYA